VEGKDAELAYLALWCAAFGNAPAAVVPAQKLLKHKKPELRWVATRILVEMQHDAARKVLLPALDDPDLRISATAIDAFQGSLDEKVELLPDLFERLQRLIERAPAKPQKYPPPLWPWTVVKFSKAEVAAVLAEANGAESTSRLIPYLSSMEGYVRARVIGKIGEQKRWDPQT